MVYNSYHNFNGIFFDKNVNVNLHFLGYFPFNYYNFLSYYNLGILCKMEAVYYDTTSYSNFGFRRMNHKFTDVDLHVSTLLFNNFKSFSEKYK